MADDLWLNLTTSESNAIGQMDFSDVNHRFQNGESQASVAAKTDAQTIQMLKFA